MFVRRPARLSAALALCLSALLQVSGPLHYLLVEHGVCAEHGEATHAAGGHHDHGSRVGRAGIAGAARPRATPGPAVAAAGDADHRSHEHCLLACRPRVAATVGPAPVVASVVGLRAAPSPLAPDRAHRAPALQLAPKTSPPDLG
ncbi:MAG: hypothetical protein PVI30_04885 [Myxococcales bacterium]